MGVNLSAFPLGRPLNCRKWPCVPSTETHPLTLAAWESGAIAVESQFIATKQRAEARGRQISPSYVCNGNVSSVWMKGFRSHKKSNTTVEKKTWFHSISLTEFGQISLFCRRNINEEEAFTAQHKFLVYYRFTVVRDTMFCPNKCNIIITDLFCYVIEDGVCSLYRWESSWCFLFIVSQKILPNLFIS